MDFLSKKCLGEIMMLEQRLLNEKVKLALCKDFSPTSCHRLFTLDPLKKLTPKAIMDAVQALGLQCTLEQAKLVCARYDADADGKLSFWEFSNIYLPAVDKQVMRDIEDRQLSSDLSQSTLAVIRKVTALVVEVEDRIESIRQHIHKMFNKKSSLIADIFGYIEQTYKPSQKADIGAITRSELIKFFSDLQVHLSEREQLMIDCLVRRFNKDKQHGRVSLPEWISELQMKLL